MARGADGKARRKEQRKEARAEAAKLQEGEYDEFPGAAADDDEGEEEEDTSKDIPFFDITNPSPSGAEATEASGGNDEDDAMPQFTVRKTKVVKKKKKIAQAVAAANSGNSKGIKTGPLIMLVLMFGTAIIPAMLYMGDYVGGLIQRHHILGNLGYRLGFGPSPKKRVLSFYEKHDPSKIQDVPKILSKHYGDYPKLIKKLERKYQDYGYFMDWQQDESPYKLAMEKLEVTAKYMEKKWKRYAPLPLQTGFRNAKHNISKLYRKGRVIWKKKLWPLLEPYFGVPDGGAAQKRKDAKEARERKNNAKKKGNGGARSNLKFRDDEM